MRNTIDAAKLFPTLRAALLNERGMIQNRLQRIDAVLASVGKGATTPLILTPNSTKMAGKPPGKSRRPRTANKLNIREAIALTTVQKPLTVREIVAAVQKVGYTFATSNPANSVGAFLYSPRGKKNFKNSDGKFSLIGKLSSSAPTLPVRTGKAVQTKRRMSANGRKRIAAAQKARWAKAKAMKAMKQVSPSGLRSSLK